ncbi:dTDP-4-dehydrorhamnose reductase [Candidatus Macondimonas diazotrophica]|nr:dTDP-4-dehydrorhamnose reductase [Candidatus Macondimonas diazotrophica]
MNILVTGAGGQLGRELSLRLGPNEAVCLPRAALDLTDPAAVHATFMRLRPQVVINAAAYTAVDRAETERDLAFATNAEAPATLARACAQTGAALLHVSTDYVFNGQSRRPWREADATDPINAYGASKLAGEQAIGSALPRHLVLRTAWVFGAHGANFVRTVLRLARERGALRIIDDQVGSPTWAGHLAEALITLARRIAGGESLAWGTYHYAGAPAVSWHGFAEIIVREAVTQGLLPAAVPIEAIDTAAYPTPARRPAWSVLDGARFAGTFGLKPPDWRIGLTRTLTAWKTSESAA